MLLVALASITTWAQNELTAPEITGGRGKVVAIPLSMENADEVVAVQFDVTLPYRMPTGQEPTLASQRNKNGHTISYKAVSAQTHKYKYRFVIANMSNKPFAGTGGDLINIPQDVDKNDEPDTPYAITLENVILTNRQGDNILTSTRNGSYTIMRDDSPDLEVSNVGIAQEALVPGQKVDFTWKVTNIGAANTNGGWIEKVYLVSTETQKECYVGRANFNSMLYASGYVTRNINFTLPDVPGIIGDVTAKVVVEPVANMGEYLADRANNSATGGAATLAGQLTLKAAGTSMKEGESMRFTLTRSGDTSTDEQYTLTSSQDGALTMPAEVTIPAGQSIASFIVSCPDNDDINAYSDVTVTARADYDYADDATLTIAILDNELIPLTIALDKSEYDEGDVIHMTATVPYLVDGEDVTLHFGAESPRRFKLPAAYTLPKGEKTAVIDIPIVDDNIPTNVETIQLSVSAEHHASAQAFLILNDNDVPAIEFQLTKEQVSEGDGFLATRALITRTSAPNSKVTIKMTDDSQGAINHHYPTVTLPEGVMTANVPLGIIDNNLVDGTRQYNITATVFITDCGCEAIGQKQTTVTRTLTVYDNDGPAILLTADRTMIHENDPKGLLLTVSRNDATQEALQVTLTTDESSLQLPHTVTIPAGQTSVEVVARTQPNNTAEGDRIFHITASCGNRTPGIVTAQLSDDTRPDAEMLPVELPSTIVAGEKFNATFRVRNVGVMPLSQADRIVIKYMDRFYAGVPTTALAAGEEGVFTGTITAPQVPGRYNMVAVYMSSEQNELTYNNNETPFIIDVVSHFKYEVQADKTTYGCGEKVTLTGTTSMPNGELTNNAPVEAFLTYANSRIPLEATTDGMGHFTAEYVIPEGMGGQYGYGAAVPGEDSYKTSGTFNVYAFTRSSVDYITNKLFVDEPFVSTIKFKNMSTLDLHNIKGVCSQPGDYDVTIGDIKTLRGKSEAELTYTIVPKSESKLNDWDLLTFEFTSDEGAKHNVKLYNYTQTHVAKLVASTNSITTSVTKGKTRMVPITLTNVGLSETGRISVALPQNLSNLVSLATPAEMASLATGDSTTVMLKFNSADYDVNIIQKGSIAINCEKTKGQLVYFNVKVVSEDKGDLLVRVRDEFTIYGDQEGNHPYLAGATVTLRDYNTGTIMYSDVTGEDGTLLLKGIDEGYYHLHVTADRHETYDQNILVNPGETTEHLVTISYNPVTVDWVVEETEIKDEYEIQTNLVFETYVPEPVVLMDVPDTILLENIERGKSLLFNMVLRNKGFITAQDVEVQLPEAKGYVFVPLTEYFGFDLAPEQSYVIPVLVMHKEDYESDQTEYGVKREGLRRSDDIMGPETCNGFPGAKWKWPCGDGAKFSWLKRAIQYAVDRRCMPRQGATWEPFTNYSGPGFGGRDGQALGYGGIGPGGDAAAAAVIKFACMICEILCNDPMPPCGTALINNAVPAPHNPDFPDVTDDGGGFFRDCFNEAVGAAIDKGASKFGTMGSGVAAIMSDEKDEFANQMTDMVFGPKDKDKDKGGKAPKAARAASLGLPALLESAVMKYAIFCDYMSVKVGLETELLGAPQLMEENAYGAMAEGIDLVKYELDDMYAAGTLWDFDINTIPDETSVTDKSEGIGPFLTSLMPSGRATMLDFDLRRFVDRYRNELRRQDGLPFLSQDYMRKEIVDSLLWERQILKAMMIKRGIATVTQLLQSSHDDWAEYQKIQSSNVCAHVKLEFKQKLVLTRQGFRGTLTIDNATDHDLSDIDLNLLVTNVETGMVATSHEMQIAVESIEGFGGSKDGKWTLAGGKKGVATILFIPTKYAAPDHIVTYSFGGDLSMVDGQLFSSRSLYPVELQVKPSPELDLTYFVQRDLYGDNPLTENVIEPVIPAEFSVLIHNKGKGDANNVRMITQQPQIVENEKGLMVDFSIVSSSLNGGPKALALESDIATDFGTIASGTSSYATWDLASTLMGHFVDYDVNYTHVTDYGNPDLTLLDKVTIHELIHSLDATIGGKKYRAWLTNDFPDGHDEPDHIYLSNGTDEEIGTLRDAATLTRINATQYRLTVNVPQKQWFYTSAVNPAGKYAKLLYITNEQTGEKLDIGNFWTTDYTMQDGCDPLEDHRLHLVDLSDGPRTYSYIVEFEPMPTKRLAVQKYEADVDNEGLAVAPLEEVTVVFNKDIDHKTFTREDIQIRREGDIIEDVPLPITRIDGNDQQTFKINTSLLDANGYYVMTVMTDSIRDLEGFWGAEGKQMRWMLFKDGLIHYNIEVSPRPDMGEVESTTGYLAGSMQFSTQGTGGVIHVTATPNDGYVFRGWYDTKSDTYLSTDPDYEFDATRDIDVKAVFEATTHKLMIACNYLEGETDGNHSGSYDHGTPIYIKPTPREGYQLVGYRVNGDLVETTEPYTGTLDKDMTIVVVFRDMTPVRVILNETNDYTPEDIAAADVRLYRGFRKNAWNTICLPCDVLDPEAVFGEGTKVAEYVGNQGQTMMFALTPEMKANVPYLIRPTSIYATVYANETTPWLIYNLGVTALESPDEEDPTVTFDDNSFIGTYTMRAIEKDAGNYFINSDKFYYIGTTTDLTTKPFYGYFHSTNELNTKLQLGFEDANGILLIGDGKTGHTGIYRVDGTKVRGAGESLDRLTPGLYIVDGKKVLVK